MRIPFEWCKSPCFTMKSKKSHGIDRLDTLCLSMKSFKTVSSRCSCHFQSLFALSVLGVIVIWLLTLRSYIIDEIRRQRFDRLLSLIALFLFLAGGLSLTTYARLALHEGQVYQGPARIVGYDDTFYTNKDGETMRADLEVSWGGSWACPETGAQCVAYVHGALCETKYDVSDNGLRRLNGGDNGGDQNQDNGDNASQNQANDNAAQNQADGDQNQANNDNGDQDAVNGNNADNDADKQGDADQNANDQGDANQGEADQNANDAGDANQVDADQNANDQGDANQDADNQNEANQNANNQNNADQNANDQGGDADQNQGDADQNQEKEQDEEEEEELEEENEDLEEENEELEEDLEDEEEYEEELEDEVEEVYEWAFEDDAFGDDYWQYDWDSVWGDYACEDLFETDLEGITYDPEEKPGSDEWPTVLIYGSCNSCEAYLMDYYSTDHFNQIKEYQTQARNYVYAAIGAMFVAVIAIIKQYLAPARENEVELLKSEESELA